MIKQLASLLLISLCIAVSEPTFPSFSIEQTNQDGQQNNFNNGPMMELAKMTEELKKAVDAMMEVSQNNNNISTVVQNDTQETAQDSANQGEVLNVEDSSDISMANIPEIQMMDPNVSDSADQIQMQEEVPVVVDSIDFEELEKEFESEMKEESEQKIQKTEVKNNHQNKQPNNYQHFHQHFHYNQGQNPQVQRPTNPFFFNQNQQVDPTCNN